MSKTPVWIRFGAAAGAVAIAALLVAARFEASSEFHHQMALQRDAVILPLVEVVGARDTHLAQQAARPGESHTN